MHAVARSVTAPESTREAPASGTGCSPAALFRSVARVVELPTLAVAVAIHGGWLALTAMSVRCRGGWSCRSEAFSSRGTARFNTRPSTGIRPDRGASMRSLDLCRCRSGFRTGSIASASRPSSRRDADRSARRSGVVLRHRRVLGGGRTAATRVAAPADDAGGPPGLWPPTVMLGFFIERDPPSARRRSTPPRAWAAPLAVVAVVLAWLALVCHISVVRYFSSSFIRASPWLLRSFAEHRPAEPPPSAWDRRGGPSPASST